MEDGGRILPRGESMSNKKNNDFLERYSFLDYGLPVEPSRGEEASEAMTDFLKYCASIGKTASQLTEEELKAYHDRCCKESTEQM